MKKLVNVLIRCSYVTIGLGLLMVMISYFTGATKNPDWRKNLNLGVANITEEFGKEEIKSIHLKMNFGKIVVKNGTNFKIEAKNIKKNEFAMKVQDGVWTIDQKAGWNLKLTNGLWPFYLGSKGNQYVPNITVYIPEDFAADDFNIDMVAGSVRIERLVATNSTSIKLGSGKVVIREIMAYNANVKCGTGLLYANGSILGNSRLVCSLGKVIVDLDGKEENFSYSIDCDLGKVKINGKTNGALGSVYEIKNVDAVNYMFLESGLGRVNLNIVPQ